MTSLGFMWGAMRPIFLDLSPCYCLLLGYQ